MALPPIRSAALALAMLTVLVLSACGGSSPPKRTPADVEVLQSGEAQARSAGHIHGYKPTGRLIADSGFRPERDGFAFENYTDRRGIANLTPGEVEELFGPEVCASGRGATCMLTPPAKAWLQMENRAMAAGHCFGLAVASLRFFKRDLDTHTFGAPVPVKLALEGNANLQHTVAQANATQELPATRDRAIAGEPNEILDRLIATLKARDELYAIGLFKPDGAGGHALTPYAVEDRGNGRFAVLVYDNNYPRVTRAISFDRHANAWKFVAQANPRDPRQLYEGHAGASNLALYPSGLHVGDLPCPFCKGAPARDGHRGFNEIVLEGDPSNHAHLLITDSQGRRTGYVGRRFVDEIPGAEVVRRLNNQDWLEDAEPAYRVPVGKAVTIAIDGRTLKRPAIEQLQLIGPGDDAAVSGIELRPGEQVHVSFAGDGSGLNLRTDPHHVESPVLRLGVEARPADYDFAVRAHRLEGGSTIHMSLDQRRKQLELDTHDRPRPGLYGVRVEREDARGRQVFSHDNLSLPNRATARFDYGRWTPAGQMLTLEVEQGGRTRIERLRSR